jgi:hypothetical protein
VQQLQSPPAQKIPPQLCVTSDMLKLKPGEQGKFRLTVQNSSDYAELSNVVIKFDAANNNPVIILNGNTIVISKLGPNGQKNLSVPFVVKEQVKEDDYQIPFTLSGSYFDNGALKQITEGGVVVVGVRQDPQPLNIGVRALLTRQKVNEGDDVTLKLSVRNEAIVPAWADPTKVTAYNVAVSVLGPDGNSLFDLYPANLIAGGAATDKSVKVTPELPPPPEVQPGQNPSREPVPYNLTLVVTFKDSSGKEYSITRRLDLSVVPRAPFNDLFGGGGGWDEDGGVALPPLAPPGEEAAGLQGQDTPSSNLKIWIFCGVGIIVVGIVAFIVVKRIKLKRSLEEDEDI